MMDMQRFSPRVLVAGALLLLLPTRGVTAETLVVVGGTVHSLAGDPITGSVVIEEGVIRHVGPTAPAPRDAPRIDASGLHIYPGLFDAFSTLGLVEVSAIAATVDTTELGNHNPHLQAATAIHPASEVIPVTRANGITQALVAPGINRRTGVIGGQAALVHLGGWTVEEMAIDPSIAMVIQWPPVVTSGFDFSTFSRISAPYNEAKETADEARNGLRDWLDAARHYNQAKDSERSERNLKLEALAKVLDGGQRVILLADTEGDIESAVQFAESENLDMILAGGRDAWKVKDLLAEKDIPVILGRTQSLPPEDDDPYDRAFRNAGELAAAGVRITFSSGAGGGFGPGGPHSSRTVPYEAATATGYGLPRDEALKAITTYPAEIFGVGDRLGTIETGKIANLIVTDGDPLEITTQILHVIIGGKVVSMDNRHDSLYQRYRSRPEAAEK
ncbi:MAG: amidohydrolase family protein [Acidobacteriota bacterium]